MSEISAFKYEPLIHSTGYIRIAVLERGVGNAPIHFRLTNVPLDQSTDYEALSYEWGRRINHDQPIYVNGNPYLIRKNLYDALIRIRRSEWGRPLWIDALCIDQNNISERNEQVKLMGRIYRQAWDVLVWLGPSRDRSDLAISHLRRIGLGDRAANDKLFNDKDNAYEAEMRAIAALCTRTYWRRIWVVQEIVLARQITYCCGDDILLGEVFTAAGKYIEHARSSRIQHLITEVRESLASKIMGYTYRDLTLKQWLIKTQDSFCSDPRDKVFALLNLATDCRGKFLADYEMSLSKVYREVLRFCTNDRLTKIPCYDGFDLAHVLQRALNNHIYSVQLSSFDTDPIWVCGIFSAEITSFDRPDKPVLRHTLYPKNIFEGHNSTWHSKAMDCILGGDTSKCISFIRKRRSSHFAAPVEQVDSIMIAATPAIVAFRNPWTIEPQTPDRTLKSQFKDPRDNGKPCYCSAQGCSGFAPTDARIGDRICRFPQSRIGLVFRRVSAVEHVHPDADSDSSSASDVSFGEMDEIWHLVGRAIMDERFQISEKETERFWRGDPTDLSTVSFGSEHGWYLRLNMVTLQRLTAE